MPTGKLRITIATLAIGAQLTFASVAMAGGSLTVHASFSPDQLGAPTNLSLTSSILSGSASAPPPVTKITLYAPAGIEIDRRGAGTCAAATLEQQGPAGCPIDSRAGFGGGVGVLELPTETIHEPYTLDLYFAGGEHGHLSFLVYASATKPISDQLVLVANQIPAPKPYGLGFSVEVPPIAPFPGSGDASIESAFVTVGAPNVAYYESVHGKRKLVHLRGLVVPKRCPAGGFPFAGTVDFADGSTLSVNSAIACPQG
jgi:hypothetical protein